MSDDTGNVNDATVITGDAEMTLRDIAESLPSTATIMARVGESWWRLIYAARGGNWPLAAYHLKQVGKLEEILKVVRPKHKERLERFQANALPAVSAALEARDLGDLEQAYAAATDMANELHAESDYPYIKWVLPDEPPQGLQLSPVEGAEG